MLEVLRFWFTKDLKYVKGKPCKPYNSTLGEFFRVRCINSIDICPLMPVQCTWEVEDTAAPISATSISAGARGKELKVNYLTEQTSHHPPVSAFYIDCPQRGVTARGFDQITAKFTGTSIRVSPGEHNLGIFVNIEPRDNEEYQLTHPSAHLGGLLRGALSISVADACFVTCPRTRIKAILQYLEESWIGRSQYRVEGVIFRYNPEKNTVTKIKDVPQSDVLARINGSWHGKIYFTKTTVSSSSASLSTAPATPSSPLSTEQPQLLIDITPLLPVAKKLPPEEDQLPNESRKFWHDVTTAILEKRFGDATNLKHDIEERQRQKAAERKENHEEWKPRFFVGAVTPLGKPELTEEGRYVLQKLHENDYKLEKSRILGA